MQATHGQHNRLRAPGSIGAGSDPSRVFKGLRMAGRMGRKTGNCSKPSSVGRYRTKSLVVKGAVPGKILCNYQEMELVVLNTSGKETGRKVQPDEAIFGIEPNQHAVYLEVKQYLAAQRQGTHKSKKEAKLLLH